MDINAHVKCNTNTTPVIRRNNIRRNNGDNVTDWDREYRQSMQYGGSGEHRWEIGIRPALQGRQCHHRPPGIIHSHFRRGNGRPGYRDTIRRVHFAPVLSIPNPLTNSGTNTISVSQWWGYRDVRRANDIDYDNYHDTYDGRITTDRHNINYCDTRSVSLGWNIMSQPPKKKVGARVIRAIFNGFALGILGGVGVYLLATAVNDLSGTTTLNPIAFLLLILGGSVTASVGIELSKDLSGE